MRIHDPKRLVESLCALPGETGWVEFKENNFNEDSIGQYVSSLANSAMFDGKDAAYLLFGVKDGTHEVVGTRVDLSGETVGAESFVFWLSKHIDPKLSITLEHADFDGKRVEIMCIDPGYRQPVKFKKVAYIRIGACQQPLSNHTERERSLWQITSRYSFETSLLEDHMDAKELNKAFAYANFLSRLGKPITTHKNALRALVDLELIKSDMQGKYQVLSLLAVMCAKNFREFPSLEHKGSRVVVYAGRDKLKASDDRDNAVGHLVVFTAMLDHVMSRIPSSETMVHGVRTKVYDIPEPAIREFLANAIVHQDLTALGSKPLVEIFKDRVRITNPGEPLVSVDRFIDTPSKTRNPRFAKFMRDAGYCEQRGSGVDRAITAIEKMSLPPPLIEAVEGSTVVTIFMARPFASMSQDERLRACFQHACLRHEQGESMSNSSLRVRFGLSEKQYPQVSLVIRDAIEAGRIKPLSEDQGNRNARYVPYFAVS